MLINHIGVSGGKDSTALLLWAVHESGYDHNSLDVTCSDTEWENRVTIDYIRMLSETVWPIRILKPPLGFFELAKKKKRFPSAKARFCTDELKIKPMTEYINTLFAQGNTVRLHSGVRAGESDQRAKMLEREFDGNSLCEIYRPMLHKDMEWVWGMHKKYGVTPNPLYAMGQKRVGCKLCVMNRKDGIRSVADHTPEAIDDIERAEIELTEFHGSPKSFFHASCVPRRFRTRPFTTKKGKQIFVTGIRDVVEWAQTEMGAKQIMAGRDPLQPTFDFIKRTMDDFGKDEETHNCQSGFCE